MANDGASLDFRHKDQESQHGTLLEDGMGLEGLIVKTVDRKVILTGCTEPTHPSSF